MNIPTPLFDSHMHLFRGGFAEVYSPAFANRDEVALYESLRTVHNIERALVVGYEGAPQFEGNNRDLAGWARRHDWMTPLEYYDAEKPPQLTHLNDPHRGAFAGISLYVMTQRQAQALNEWPVAILDWLNEQRAIISLNAEPEILDTICRFPARLDNCRVLVSHCGLPGAYAQPPSPSEAARRLEPLHRLSTLAHVGVKLSAFYAMSDPLHDYPHLSAHPFLNRLRDGFGAQRLFWGSDFSPALEYVSFAQTIDVMTYLDWPADEKKAVFSDNLRRLLAG